MRWPFARPRTATVDRPWPERGRAKHDRVERLDPQSAYVLWADHYPPQPHNRLMEIEQATVLSLLPDLRGLTVLDAGCGTGRYLRALAARGASTMGIDLSEPMLAQARQMTGRVARADLRALPFQPVSIDLVVCGLALGDVAELEHALSEIARVLRSGGQVVYSVVHPAGGPQGWSRTFEVEGRHCEIDSHWHSLNRHRRACAAAGLTVDCWCEPGLDGTSGQPVALVVRARR